ncbi:MAG: NAD(P)H-hydrate dehydratase [Lachnospiraceae bacterium]|nr:NAD(P)H-hydrate dehydratase [Lachnospiraceae bacterium]
MLGLYTAAEMKSIEKYTIEKVGIPSLVLMEKAAEAVSRVICAEAGKYSVYGKYSKVRVIVLCGTGNNGGDGMAVARILHLKGMDVSVFVVGDEAKATEEYKTQKNIYINCGGKTPGYAEIGDTEKDNALLAAIEEADIIVDAMLGIGISGSLRKNFEYAVTMLNEKRSPVSRVIAVDIPTGLNADDGTVGNVAVSADITVTLGRHKRGLWLGKGKVCSGQVICDDINILCDGPAKITALEENDMTAMLPGRVKDSNKSTYGKLLVVAGSDNMPGASLLCSRAAMKAGVGMVKLFTSATAAKTVIAAMPEIMTSDYDKEDVSAAFDWSDALVIGPGLGRDTKAAGIFEKVYRDYTKPLIIDADGLYHLRGYLEKGIKRSGVTIVTPHPKEFANLFGSPPEDKCNSSPEYVADKAREYGLIIVAKDSSVIISDGKDTCVNISGTNALSTAGTGDVLAGLTAALLLNTENAYDACRLATLIHGLAGQKAAEKLGDYGVTASDVIDEIVEVMKQDHYRVP